MVNPTRPRVELMVQAFPVERVGSDDQMTKLLHGFGQVVPQRVPMDIAQPLDPLVRMYVHDLEIARPRIPGTLDVAVVSHVLNQLAIEKLDRVRQVKNRDGDVGDFQCVRWIRSVKSVLHLFERG